MAKRRGQREKAGERGEGRAKRGGQERAESVVSKQRKMQAEARADSLARAHQGHMHHITSGGVTHLFLHAPDVRLHLGDLLLVLGDDGGVYEPAGHLAT